MGVSDKHKTARLHANEAERLQALRSYGILDTAIKSAFDDITRIASYVCQTPISAVSLVDGSGSGSNRRSVSTSARRRSTSRCARMRCSNTRSWKFPTPPRMRASPTIRWLPAIRICGLCRRIVAHAGWIADRHHLRTRPQATAIDAEAARGSHRPCPPGDVADGIPPRAAAVRPVAA